MDCTDGAAAELLQIVHNHYASQSNGLSATQALKAAPASAVKNDGYQPIVYDTGNSAAPPSSGRSLDTHGHAAHAIDQCNAGE